MESRLSVHPVPAPGVRNHPRASHRWWPNSRYCHRRDWLGGIGSDRGSGADGFRTSPCGDQRRGRRLQPAQPAGRTLHAQGDGQWLQHLRPIRNRDPGRQRAARRRETTGWRRLADGAGASRGIHGADRRSIDIAGR